MPSNWLIGPVAALALVAAAPRATAQDLTRDGSVWVDDRSQPVKLESLKGRPTILTMAYGACRRICSTSLRVMQDLQARADQRGIDLNFVVVGLDPAEDKPSDWAGFRTDWKLGRTNWRFLWGDEAATRALAQRLGVHYWLVDQHILHDFKIVLLSPEGRLVRTMEHFDDPPDTLIP